MVVPLAELPEEVEWKSADDEYYVDDCDRLEKTVLRCTALEISIDVQIAVPVGILDAGQYEKALQAI